MLFNSETYKYLKSVSFCGYTFNFAAVAYGAYDDIVYTFCDTDPSAENAKSTSDKPEKGQDTGSKQHGLDQNKRESASDREDHEKDQQSKEAGDDRTTTIDSNWTPPLALDFPFQVRAAGMSLLTQDVVDTSTSAVSPSTVLAAQAPFDIVIDNINLWIIRRSSDLKSLLVDRFIFDKGAKQLNKANEVRFVRSGNPDLPATDRDSYGAGDLDGNAFVEPTWLVQLDIAAPRADTVAALLIPDSTNSKRARWHFFLTNQVGGVNRLRHYTIPYTEFAWFDLTGQYEQVSSTGVITAHDELIAASLNIAYASATQYEQQETSFVQVGEPQRVKRAVRAMLSCHATGTAAGAQSYLAAFDFSIGLDGHLTAIPSSALTIPRISNYACVLHLDGRGGSVMSSSTSFSSHAIFVSCWIRWDGPNAKESGQTVVSLEPGTTSRSAICLEIKNDGIVRIVSDSASYCSSRLPLLPGQWANLSFTMDATGGSTRPTKLWLNGYKVATDNTTGFSALSYSLRCVLGKRFKTATDSTSGEKFFNGAVAQFYAINAYVDQANLVTGTHDYVYNASAAALSSTLVFWGFGEGTGTTTANSGTGGTTLAGSIDEATWQADVSPAQPAMPIVSLDQDYLDIRAIVLEPTQSGGHAAEPAVDTPASFMTSGDGLLHLYYRRQDNHAAAVHLNTASERVRLQLLQKDGDVWTSMLALVSRQSGTSTGLLQVSFGSISSGVFSQVQFLNPGSPSYYETWRNVPVRLDEFCQVLNGKAALPFGGTSETVYFQIDCGSSVAVAPYAADSHVQGGSTATTSNAIDLTGVVAPAPPSVYQTERCGVSTYTFTALDTASSYRIRLHFTEFYWSQAGERVFNVAINSVTVLSNFDIFAQAGGANKAIVREFTVFPTQSGQIVIQGLMGSADQPKFSAIELLSPSQTSARAGAAAAAWGQVTYDYASNVLLNRPHEGMVSPEGAFASEMFEAVGNSALLVQNPPPSFTGAPDVVAYAGRDCGWVMSPLQPAFKLNGTSGPIAYASAAPALDIPGDLTMQGWLELRSNSSKAGMLAVFNGTNTDYSVSLDASGCLVARRYGFQSGSSGQYYGVSRTSLQPVAAQTYLWTHFAAVYHASFGLALPSSVYVDCGHDKALDADEGLTLEAWVKFDSSSANNAAIVSRKSFVEDDSAYDLTVVTTQANANTNKRNLIFNVWLESGAVATIDEQFTCNTNTWVHLAATYRPDRSLNYLHFETNNENYVQIGSLSEAPLTTFTAELYFSPRGSQKQSFLSLNRNGSSNGNTNYFGLRYTSESGHSGSLCIEIEGQKTYILPSDWTSTSSWQFLSVVIETDSTHTYITAYVNGTIVSESGGHKLARWVAPARLNPGASTSDNFYPWLIGGEWDSGATTPSDYMDTDLSEVRIWNSARTPTQVLDNLYAPLTGKEDGMLAFLLFDADAGSGQTNVPNRSDGTSCSIHSVSTSAVPDWRTQSFTGSSRLYVNGTRIGKLTSTGPSKNIRTTQVPLAIGQQAVAPPHAEDAWHLDGAVDNVRVWRVARAPAQLGYFSLNPVPDPSQQAALAAFWAFDEGQGDRVTDLAGGAAGRIVGMRFAQLSDADSLWIASPFDADWTLYLDGVEVQCADRALLTSSSVTAGSTGLVIGAEKSSGYSQVPTIYLSELQIWSLARPQEDIARTLHQMAMAPEDGLEGYYRLNEGSGNRAADSSGNAADAAVTNAASAWGTPASAVPVRDEASYIIATSNHYASPEANKLFIWSAPAVVEDRLSQGRIYSFLVSDAASPPANAGGIFSEMGVPLADTELVYLGQVQYKPRVIGFIEGAPPVPSENLMIDSPSTPDRYVGNARILLNRSNTARQTATAGLDANVGLAGSLGLGNVQSAALATVIGGWAGVAGGAWQGGQLPTLKEATKKSGKLDVGGNLSFGYAESASVEETTSKSFGIDFCGGWENNVYKIPGDIANARTMAGQRLYRGNNMGAAVVKSRTADNYAVRSRKTKAMLGYKVIPNAEIPEDINVLMFKLNPKYIKNGTLDGYIGFDKDIDYRDLSDNRKASYFKPEEAYRLKKSIERGAQRALSDARQFNPFGGLSAWNQQATRTSIANTYVWMADGGFLSENSDFSTSFSESFSGGASVDGSLGGRGAGQVQLGWGLLEGASWSLDAAISGKLDIRYSHEEENTMAASLEAQVTCEGFLNRVLTPQNWTTTPPGATLQTYETELNSGAIDTTDTAADSLNGLFLAHGVTLTAMNYVTPDGSGSNSWTMVDVYTRYTISLTGNSLVFTYLALGPASGQYPVNYDNASPPCPGKVRGYRYMSFYLAPDKGNFETFFAKGTNQIIDPAWLAGTEPDAIALRQASAIENEVWRVLHRVTYVNRVVPSEADVPEESELPQGQDVAAKPVRPDEHSIRQNSLIVSRVLRAACPDAPPLAVLDLDSIDLDNVDFDAVGVEIDAILDDMQIINSTVRRLYSNEMNTFFRLLLAPN